MSSQFDDDIGAGVAVQSCVYREYRSGLRTQPCGAPVLRIRGDVFVAHSDHLTSACQDVQDPAAQRSVHPRVWSFATSVAAL